jgi:DNA-binding GntR family transcriptional regulator
VVFGTAIEPFAGAIQFVDLAMSENAANSSLGQSARHRVRNGVEQMILRGDFQSGTKLKQIFLAEHFGVAQGVVREALLELQAMGLVETIDNRGVYVTQINGKRLIDAMEIRIAIEGMAARLCCERSTHADHLKLQRLCDEIYRLADAGSSSEAASLDREFHLEMIQQSGNDELLRITHSYRAYGKIIRINRAPNVVHDEHIAIVTAIQNSNADEAERVARLHLNAVKSYVKERLLTDVNFIPNWVV